MNVIVEGVTAKAEEIAAVKEDAESDLKKAQPAMDAAVSALNSIKASDIATVKALKKPPDLIARILDTVLVLRQYPMSKIDWHDVKGVQVINALENWSKESMKMMGESGFLASLMNFPKGTAGRAFPKSENTARFTSNAVTVVHTARHTRTRRAHCRMPIGEPVIT